MKRERHSEENMINRITILFLMVGSLFAAEKTFVREYTYQASDYDSKVTSRANALEQVKRILLEEVSVYMQSEFETKEWEKQIGKNIESGEFAQERIVSITAGVTETKILEEKWTGVAYWIKAEITLDPDDIKSKIDKVVKNKEKLKELEDVKKKADDALLEIERLKRELAKSKSDADQLRLTKAYNKETDALSATDWFTKGYNAYENKEYDKAISFYLRAIELDPDDDAAYYNLGIAYNSQGNLTKAIQLYEKAIELDPDDADAYINLGIAYYNLGKRELLISNYKKAARLGHQGAQDWLRENGYKW